MKITYYCYKKNREITINSTKDTQRLVYYKATEKECAWHKIPEGSYIIRVIDVQLPKHNNGVGFGNYTEWISGVTGRTFNGIIPGRKKQEIFFGSNLGGCLATTNITIVKKIFTDNGIKILKKN